MINHFDTFGIHTALDTSLCEDQHTVVIDTITIVLESTFFGAQVPECTFHIAQSNPNPDPTLNLYTSGNTNF